MNSGLLVFISVASVYFVGLFTILMNVQKKCECPHCRTDIHLERKNRPRYVRRFYDYLTLKFFHCRRCHATFYLGRDTPDSEPVRMDRTAPKNSYT